MNGRLIECDSALSEKLERLIWIICVRQNSSNVFNVMLFLVRPR